MLGGEYNNIVFVIETSIIYFIKSEVVTLYINVAKFCDTMEACPIEI